MGARRRATIRDALLAAAPPQEGAKTVADAFSRYEYDVFSGAVLGVKSTAVVPAGGLLRSLGRAVGLVRQPAVAAIHEFTLQVGPWGLRQYSVMLGLRAQLAYAAAKAARAGVPERALAVRLATPAPGPPHSRLG